MKRRAPPLQWVRVFESAARHGNFVAAARELSVSPAAVSRTVKELENFTGVKLFVRRTRGVQLTQVARRYASAVGPALAQIAAASRELAQSATASGPIEGVAGTPVRAFLDWLYTQADKYEIENRREDPFAGSAAGADGQHTGGRSGL